MVSLPLYRAQRRRAVLAAQAHARRRAVIGVVLAVLGLVASAVVLEREVQLQRLEAQQYLIYSPIPE